MYIITLDGKRALNPGADTAKRVLDLGTGTGIWALEFGMCFAKTFFMRNID
jgi:methylase of polypeptide subunit release factors